MEKLSSMKPVPVPKKLGTAALRYLQKALHSPENWIVQKSPGFSFVLRLSCRASRMDSGIWGGGPPVFKFIQSPLASFCFPLQLINP